MDTSDITLTVGIFIVFFFLFSVNVLTNGVNNIKQNWPKYRCHPAVLPTASIFGHDTEENFAYCISNMGSNVFASKSSSMTNMGGSLTSSLGGLGDSTNSMRGMMSSMRGSFGGGMGGIFGMLANVVVVVQRIAGMIMAIVY